MSDWPIVLGSRWHSWRRSLRFKRQYGRRFGTIVMTVQCDGVTVAVVCLVVPID
uniref:Uncharacterized protein n=1 Tax=Physcomitrium patens TaxID=3218 RepID=A0A2K1KQD5_PHYPA|nr:hypothetical protein PHYPA_006875 [Physcomitrium patens]